MLKIVRLHSEKYFVESTKIWLVQLYFSFRYGSMEILFELTKNIVDFFLQFQQKNFPSISKSMEL